MSPSSLEKYAREAGIDMKDIIIIYARNDFPNWGINPISGYSNPPTNGWNCIYIEEDHEREIGDIPGFGGHAAPVHALRGNHDCTIRINGGSLTRTELSQEVIDLLQE